MKNWVLNFCLAVLTSSLLCASGQASQEPTVILFMVDGIRPDFLNHLVHNTDKLPNIRRHFYQNGTVMNNAYTTLSLTLPSWSETLSGIAIDRSSFKGNEIFDRRTKVMTNYLDWRKDIFYGENRKHGRAYRRMKKNQHTLILDYFRDGEVDSEGFLIDNEDVETDSFSTFFPLNDRFPRYLIPGMDKGPKGGSVLRSLLHLDLLEQHGIRKTAIRFLFEDSFFNLFDRAGLDHVMAEMNDTSRPRKRFLGVYLAGGDHYFHLEHHKGLDTLYQIDHALGRIFQAMRRGKYRNSVVAMVSDHGSQGGKELASNINHPLRGEDFDITVTNLCNYFSGRVNDSNFLEYDFNVTGAFATEGRYSMFGGAEGDFFRNLNLKELALHSGQCTNVRRELYADYGTCAQLHKTEPHRVHAAVSSSQSVSLAKGSFNSQRWSETNNWYDLTHYQVGIDGKGKPVVRNIIADIESIRLKNLRIYPGYKDGDATLDLRYKSLHKKIGNTPMDWIVGRVSKSDFNANPGVSTNSLIADEDVLVVHKSKTNQALIIVQYSVTGLPKYRMVPVKNFDQKKTGEVAFEMQKGIDPFGYWGNPLTRTSGLSDLDWFRESHSFREWVARYSETKYPTVVPAIARVMLFRREGLGQMADERMDFMVGPNYGFTFGCGEDYSQAHHGMMIKESVQTTMMFTGPGIRRGHTIDTPQFNLDLVPTLLTMANSRLRDRPNKENSVEKGHSMKWPRPVGINRPIQFDGRVINEIFE